LWVGKLGCLVIPRRELRSALIYSLVETAKANDLEPYNWLCKVLRELPKARKSKAYEHLLPWNLKADELIANAYGK